MIDMHWPSFIHGVVSGLGTLAAIGLLYLGHQDNKRREARNQTEGTKQ